MIAETTVLGIDVSRDWLDGFCLPGHKRFRHPNTAEDHIALVAMTVSAAPRFISLSPESRQSGEFMAHKIVPAYAGSVTEK